MVVIFHMYIIVHEYFCLPKKTKKIKMGFKNQQNIFLHDYFLHMWPSPTIRNFEPNKLKK